MITESQSLCNSGSARQQLLNLTTGEHWIFLCSTVGNIQTLLGFSEFTPFKTYFYSWSFIGSCNLNLKVQADPQTSDGIDGMRTSPWPALPCFINSVCVRNRRKTTGFFHRLLSVSLPFPSCVLLLCRGTDVSRLNYPRLITRIRDFPSASHLWEPVWGRSHSVTWAPW